MALALAACAAPGSNATTAPTTVAATAAGASPGATTVPVATTPSATKAGSANAAQVDLTFTGTLVFTAKGTGGTCKLFDGHFGFEATDADFPGLGMSYSMAEFNGIVDVKWVIDNNRSYGNNASSTIQLTPDHHGITIDQDLSPFTPEGGTPSGPEHVKGTITCP